MATKKPDPNLYAGDLFGEFYQVEQSDTPRRVALRALVPGVATALIVAFAALWLSQQYGIPAILAGLLLGLALAFLAEHPLLGEGLDFVSRHFLRVGIVLLGLQVSLMQIADLGWQAFAGLIAIMAVAFASGLLGAQIAGQGRYAGVLAGGATAICGISAALALYAIVGRDRLDQARFTLTLVAVTLASALALASYPALAFALGLSDAQAGYLVGASIHDVAQAIGAGYAISDEAGGQATVIKLARVALLAPLVALAAMWLGSSTADKSSIPVWRRISVPWFILGFLALVVANSFVDLPAAFATQGLEASKFLLLLAVIATAMRAQLAVLIGAGWRPLVPVLAATIGSCAAALAVTVVVIG
ncbi:MAG: putative sulfate exporter family transporter [Pseudomonadota bacterium]